MQSLPPIHPNGRHGKPTATITSDVHSSKQPPSPSPTTASTSDGINRNKLRQEANRRVQHITCGVSEQRTYLDMLQHIREQFAHTSHDPLRPLVLPPQWPSTARPREPQLAKFSRGVALYNKKPHNVAADTGSTGEAADAAPLAIEQKRASAVTSAYETASSAMTGLGDVDTAASSASYTPTELPSTSTGFAKAHRWEAMDMDDRTYFQRILRDGTAGATRRSLRLLEEDEGEEGRLRYQVFAEEVDMQPLDELPTWEEKCAYLMQLEAAGRQRMLAYEKWDQQVVSEMMAVHFVTFVLKPCMDALRSDENEERESIRQQEEHLAFYMFHESPQVMEIEEGIKAMKARELQVERILGLKGGAGALPRRTLPRSRGSADSQTPFLTPAATPSSPLPVMFVPSPPTTESSSAASPGVSTVEARRILQQYVRQRHGADISAAAAAANTTISPASETLPTTNNTTLWSQGVLATYPAASAGFTVRRSSTLVLPPLPSAHGPRRNAVGIADYVSLLDECMAQRELILRMEQQSRRDLNRTAYEEQQVVLEWQRRRMHLERLLYWRQQRETAVQEEVAVLTAVDIRAPLNPKVVLLLELLQGEEEDGRAAIAAEEHQDSHYYLARTNTALRNNYDNVDVQRQCWAAFEKDVLVAELAARLQMLAEEEASLRRCHEEAAMQSMLGSLNSGARQLRLLWGVSVTPAQYAATLVLQSAFRRSLRGRLGWRATHNLVGREISDARNARRIQVGKQTLRSFKDTLEREAAQLAQEQAASNLRAQQHLFAGEAADRVAVSAEQDLHRQALGLARVRHVEEVFIPILERVELVEAQVRLQLEVEEDLDCAALFQSHADLTEVITRKAAVRASERSSRKSLVAEEREAWRALLGEELDRREEQRLDAEAADAERRSDRDAFASAALQASRRHHDTAFAAYVLRVTKAQLELLKSSSADDTTRRSIASAESQAAVGLFHNLSVEMCQVYAETLTRQRQQELQRVHQQAQVISETEGRALVLQSETAEWAELQPQLQELLSGPLRDLIVRRGAVNAISTWYRAVRNGDAGRAVSRQHLHEDLSRYRAQRDLQAKQVSQRLHTQQVREQLDALMQEVHHEQWAGIQQLLDIVVQREEPREREQVASLEDIVFGIISRNADAHAAELGRQLVNTEALLWQQESYERKLIKKTWQRTFAELLERERLQLSEDHFAGRIQRAWRRYAARKRQLQIVRDQRVRLAELEMQERTAVKLEELTEMALHVQKPYEASTFVNAHIQHSLSRAYAELCASLVAATSAEEWRERVALLGEMRYDLCDSVLCTEEAHARQALGVDFYKPLLLIADLVRGEAQQREALVEERVGFLLRILAREEHARRAEVAADEKRAFSRARDAFDEEQDGDDKEEL